MDDQATRVAPVAPVKRSRGTPIVLIWVVFVAMVVVAAYMQAGLLRLATFSQLLSGYDVFSLKRFDVPRLPPSKNFEVIGQRSGKLSAIAIADKYAYIGAGESLLIVSIENPKSIKIVGSLLLLGQISDIELEGHFAYICNGRGGLRIVDVRNPEKPKEVAAYGYMAVPKRTAIKSGCAYMVSGMRGLEVLDVRNPIRPVAVSFEDKAEKSGTLDSKNICIDTDRLCVMDEDQGLRLFNITDPFKPVELGEWKAGGRGMRRGATAAEGKTILVAGDSPDEGVSVLNISGTKPVLEASLDVPQYWYGTCAKLRDGFGFIGTSSGLIVVDIHDKKKLKLLSTFDKVKGITDLDLKDRRVYATDSTGDLSIIDISDPFTPLLVSRHHIGGDARMMTLSDGTLYITSSPSEIQSYKLPFDAKTLPFVQTFDFKGVRAINQIGNDIIVSDERYPTSGGRISLISLLKRQPDGTFKEAWSQTINKSNKEVTGINNTIYAAADDGIHILSKDGNQRSFQQVKGGVELLYAEENLLYAVTNNGPKETHLISFDTTDKDKLKKIGETLIDQHAYEITADQQNVYVLEGGIWGDRELSILQKNKDGSLKRLSSLKLRQADRIAVDGKRAYVQGFLQVQSVDITDAKNPKLVGSIDLSAVPLPASDLEAKDGIVYIAGQDGGVYILRDKTLR